MSDEALSQKESNQLLTAINTGDSKERLAKTEITTEATIEAFKKLSEMAKKYSSVKTEDLTVKMEKLIGQVVTPKGTNNEYLVSSMRHIGDKYLFFMGGLGESMEMIVADVRIKDGKFRMKKYTGSDYDEIFIDFLINAPNDLKCLKTKIWMKEIQQAEINQTH